MGMDIDEDFNAVIPIGSGAVIVANMAGIGKGEIEETLGDNFKGSFYSKSGSLCRRTQNTPANYWEIIGNRHDNFQLTRLPNDSFYVFKIAFENRIPSNSNTAIITIIFLTNFTFSIYSIIALAISLIYGGNRKNRISQLCYSVSSAPSILGILVNDDCASGCTKINSYVFRHFFSLLLI